MVKYGPACTLAPPDGKGAGASAAAGLSLLLRTHCCASGAVCCSAHCLPFCCSCLYIACSHFSSTSRSQAGARATPAAPRPSVQHEDRQCGEWSAAEWICESDLSQHCSWSVPRCAFWASRPSLSPSSPNTLVSSAASASTRGSRGVPRASTTVGEATQHPRDMERLLRLLAGLSTSRSAILWMNKWESGLVELRIDLKMFQQCNTVNEQQCRTVQKNECSTVQEQQCSTVNEQQCSTVNEQVSLNWILIFVSFQFRFNKKMPHSGVQHRPRAAMLNC